MSDIKYAIAKNYVRSVIDPDFISTLAHEFAGESNVIGYLDLNNALHFKSKKEAQEILNTQPQWVKNKHKIVAFYNWGISCSLL